MSKQSSPEEIAARMGFRSVPEVLVAADTPIDRGHHLALGVGRGSGVEAVYAAAAEKNCDPEGGLQCLVLVPTRDRAVEVALAMQRAMGPQGLRAAVAPMRPDGSLDVEAAAAECLVARPSPLLPEIRLGRLGLADSRLLILDGVADLEDLDEWDSVEPLLDAAGGEVRRVAVTGRVDDGFRALIRRQLPRGRRWPESLFEEGEPPDPVEAGYPKDLTVGFATSEEERVALFIGAMAGHSEVRVRCRSEESVPTVAAALGSSGFELAEAEGGWDVVARRAAADESAGSVHAWFGLPLSLEALAGGPGERAVAIVNPAHRAQLKLLASRAGTAMRFLPESPSISGGDPIGRFRVMVRTRLERGGTEAEALVLEPLAREFGMARVAEALSDLLRGSGAGDSAVRPWADVEAASRDGTSDTGARTRGARDSSAAGPAHRGTRGAWSRVFIGAGSRDSVRAGDLVGAITGETGIAGGQIGKIEIRGSFSLVEIDSQVVDSVIEKLNGTAIRGREVIVKHDRGS